LIQPLGANALLDTTRSASLTAPFSHTLDDELELDR
jgi:hypothetical protein